MVHNLGLWYYCANGVPYTYIHHLFVIAGLVDDRLRQADVDLLSKI